MPSRYDSVVNHINSIISPDVSLPEKYIRPALSEVWDWLWCQVKSQMDLSHLPEYHLGAMCREMRAYFETGSTQPTNCEIKICVNPTLLDPATLKWNLKPAVSPFEAYLNLKQASSDFLTNCQNLFGEQLSSYRSRFQELVFHIGEPLALCYKNHGWAGQFHIVDCSNLPDRLGLANILNAASITLSNDDPQVGYHITVLIQ